MKQSDAAAESESNYKSKGVASPPLGPMSLVRPRVGFRLPWDVLPPPWPPPLAPILVDPSSSFFLGICLVKS